MSNRRYAYFYLIGRQSEELESDIDVTVLAQRVLNGANLVEVAFKAATDAARATRHDGSKRDWLAENKEEIAEVGGDGELAYKLYLQGRIDELTADLDADIQGEVATLLERDEEDDDQDEDETDEDQEDEEETEDPGDEEEGEAIEPGHDGDGIEDDEPPDDGDDPWASSTRAIDARHDKVIKKSPHARYAEWEATGWKACDKIANLEQIFELPTEAEATAHGDGNTAYANVLIAKWETGHGKSIKKSWMLEHRAAVEADGLNPSKAWKRWSSGWKDCARGRLELAIKKLRGQV